MRSTTTKDSRSLPAIGLTTEELRERLRPITEKIIEDTWAKNSYLTYYDETLCPDTSYAIHAYRDRKVLVKLENGKAHLVKIL
ncbi:MAG: hypothetical protein NVSMB24_40370 [Mucilaginibacter sp.]|jgi:hypothetical protein